MQSDLWNIIASIKIYNNFNEIISMKLIDKIYKCRKKYLKKIIKKYDSGDIDDIDDSDEKQKVLYK